MKLFFLFFFQFICGIDFLKPVKASVSVVGVYQVETQSFVPVSFSAEFKFCGNVNKQNVSASASAQRSKPTRVYANTHTYVCLAIHTRTSIGF